MFTPGWKYYGGEITLTPAQCQQIPCQNRSHRARPENQLWCWPSWTLLTMMTAHVQPRDPTRSLKKKDESWFNYFFFIVNLQQNLPESKVIVIYIIQFYKHGLHGSHISCESNCLRQEWVGRGDVTGVLRCTTGLTKSSVIFPVHTGGVWGRVMALSVDQFCVPMGNMGLYALWGVEMESGMNKPNDLLG